MQSKGWAALLIIVSMQSRYPLDTLIVAADRALRAVFAPARASRPMPTETSPASATSADVPGPSHTLPSDALPSNAELLDAERRESAALMRVNHAGEVAAQALYHGQALVSRSDATRQMLLRAAREETDHLAWCETRLKELGSGPSLLNPLWYSGSFVIGVLAAAANDKTSL